MPVSSPCGAYSTPKVAIPVVHIAAPSRRGAAVTVGMSRVVTHPTVGILLIRIQYRLSASDTIGA